MIRLGGNRRWKKTKTYVGAAPEAPAGVAGSYLSATRVAGYTHPVVRDNLKKSQPLGGCIRADVVNNN